MPSSVCPCTLLELHVGSPGQQPTGAISAHVMALTHKPSFGRSVSQKGERETQDKIKQYTHQDEHYKRCPSLALRIKDLIVCNLSRLKNVGNTELLLYSD